MLLVIFGGWIEPQAILSVDPAESYEKRKNETSFNSEECVGSVEVVFAVLWLSAPPCCAEALPERERDRERERERLCVSLVYATYRAVSWKKKKKSKVVSVCLQVVMVFHVDGLAGAWRVETVEVRADIKRPNAEDLC